MHRVKLADRVLPTYTKGEEYNTLKKAYEVYSKFLKEGKYSEYKDTLPK